jgi:uncharacterized protein YndB with AHSA1/START domain
MTTSVVPHTITVRRIVAATPERLYAAWTEPDQMRQWYGTVVEADVRVGGRYRWRWRNDQDGSEFGFSGTFREVQPGSRLVHTEAYDPGTVGGGYPGEDALVTVTFTEEDGVTTLTTVMDFKSKEARDAAIATGMTDGMEQSYQLLDRLLDDQPRA